MSAHTQCLKKKGAWWTLASAQLRARQIKEEGGPTMRPYRCTHCPRWHLSSRPDRFEAKP